MNEKICKKCGSKKQLSAFHKNGKRSQFYCKQCANQVAKNWYAAKKNDVKTKENLYNRCKKKSSYFKVMINEIKESYGCCICQEKEPCCLDFHHIEEKSKNKNVSYWVERKSIRKIIDEISKCICVCSNCHRKIHAKKIQTPNSKIPLLEIIKFVEEFKIKNPIKSSKNHNEKEVIYKKCCLNCNKPTNNKNYCSKECQGFARQTKKRPSLLELELDLQNMSYCALGRKHGVSDNTIRKWIKSYKKMTPVGLAPTSFG